MVRRSDCEGKKLAGCKNCDWSPPPHQEVAESRRQQPAGHHFLYNGDNLPKDVEDTIKECLKSGTLKENQAECLKAVLRATLAFGSWAQALPPEQRKNRIRSLLLSIPPREYAETVGRTRELLGKVHPLVRSFDRKCRKAEAALSKVETALNGAKEKLKRIMDQYDPSAPIRKDLYSKVLERFEDFNRWKGAWRSTILLFCDIPYDGLWGLRPIRSLKRRRFFKSQKPSKENWRDWADLFQWRLGILNAALPEDQRLRLSRQDWRDVLHAVFPDQFFDEDVADWMRSRRRQTGSN